MLRTSVRTLVIASIVACSARAQSVGHPPTLIPDGGASLPRAAQATRVHLLGLVEFYSLAIYVEPSMLDRAHLLSSDVSKALRLEVRYKDDLRRRVSIDWRRELVPTLEPAAAAHLQGTFAPLQHGDVVLIEYVPGKGTALRVNKAVAVSDANHDLMLAFLDHWLGQRPVSDEIKRTLLGSSSD